ncbi:MAG: hypothetical protein V7K97_12745 [Nostoc sp.]|uniref:hypothetical protein n=1 Tax=Nostoc sp. TaxID=1180 RepID=UPI002FF55935
MKVNGNGRGKILTSDELRRLFSDGFTSERDRALFGISLYTGCRVSEALKLQTTDIKGIHSHSGSLPPKGNSKPAPLKSSQDGVQPGYLQFVNLIFQNS